MSKALLVNVVRLLTTTSLFALLAAHTDQPMATCPPQWLAKTGEGGQRCGGAGANDDHDDLHLASITDSSRASMGS